MELTMFERLLQLPLFQGLTTGEIAEVMAHVRLDFVNYHSGDEIVMQGERCQGLIYIIQGEVVAEFRDTDNRFCLTEHLPHLKVIEPYNLFGMYQTYSRSYSFASSGRTLSIDKAMVLRYLMANDIIKINMMNITCNKYQQTQRLLCLFPDDTVQQKILKFILAHSISRKGTKEVQIKMTALAHIIHETRLNVSIALNQLQELGFLTLQRGGFVIKNIQQTTDSFTPFTPHK